MNKPAYVTLEMMQTLWAAFPRKPKPEREQISTSATHETNTATITPDELSRRIRKYLATIPQAVSGQRGHDQTLYVAGRLVRGFSLSPEEAYPYLAEYNQRCDPPWTEHELRRKLSEASRQPGQRGFLLRQATIEQAKPGSPKEARRFRNYHLEETQAEGEEKPRIEKRGRAISAIREELSDITCGYPKRVGELLFAPGEQNESIIWMRTASELFAWIGQVLAQRGIKPPDWASGSDCPTKDEFRAHCAAACEEYLAAEQYPHEPSVPKVCYIHPESKQGDGSKLADLLRRFSPASPEDEDLIYAFFLTLFWGGPGGQRPLFIFEAASDAKNSGRGAGKSTLATVAASLCGGVLSIGVNEETSEIQKRLLGKEGRGKRVVLIDNVKSLRFSNPDIEGMIANEVISGRQMFVGEGARPNHITWVLTFNQPSVSKDFASRAVLIRINSPAYDPAWLAGIREYIESHRWEIIGDIMAKLSKPVARLEGFQFTRWSAWESGVLARAGNAHELQKVILERREEVDDDAAVTEEVRDAFISLLRDRFGSGFDPDCNCVGIPNSVIFEKIVKPFNPKMANMVHGSKWLLMMNIPELCKFCSGGNFRGFKWTGKNCTDDQKMASWKEIPE
jgi:hypothetical protein